MHFMCQYFSVKCNQTCTALFQWVLISDTFSLLGGGGDFVSWIWGSQGDECEGCCPHLIISPCFLLHPLAYFLFIVHSVRLFSILPLCPFLCTFHHCFCFPRRNCPADSLRSTVTYFTEEDNQFFVELSNTWSYPHIGSYRVPQQQIEVL